MKNTTKLRLRWLVFLVLIISGGFRDYPSLEEKVQGAWYRQTGQTETTLVFMDNYFTCAVFDTRNKQFNYTWGGPYSVEDNQLVVKTEYHSDSSHKVGETVYMPFSITGKKLITGLNADKKAWQKLDDGTADLAGTWCITGRMQNGQMVDMPARSRKTLKILSGTRFQWIAIDPAAKGFYGTGGGTYTFKDGKYTEHIEFFSRDNSRVGAALSFDGKVSDGEWEHKGLSSKGDPVHEVWQRITE